MRREKQTDGRTDRQADKKDEAIDALHYYAKEPKNSAFFQNI